MRKIKNKLKYIIILIVIILLTFLGYYCYKEISKTILENNLKDVNWLKRNINIVLDGSLGTNIYSISKNKNIINI